MADDFERAILISFQAVDGQLKVAGFPWACRSWQWVCNHENKHNLLYRACALMQEQATAYINGIKQSPATAWRLCAERFSPSSYQEVKFWCLQTLHEVSRAPVHSVCATCAVPAAVACALALRDHLPLLLQVIRVYYTQLDANSQSTVRACSWVWQCCCCILSRRVSWSKR